MSSGIDLRSRNREKTETIQNVIWVRDEFRGFSLTDRLEAADLPIYIRQQVAIMESQRLEDMKAAFSSGIHHKLSISRNEYAISDLRLAHRLATQPVPMPDIWPHVTAYRLAHLLMRSAQGKDELLEVDDLLQQASVDNAESSIRLAATIIRLSVLHRLALIEPAGVWHQLSRDCLKLAVDLARHQPLWSTLLKGRPAQSMVTNMIELAAYFMGEPHGLLSGLSVNAEVAALESDTAWRLIGTHGLGDNLRYSEALIRAQISALISNNAVDIVLNIDGSRSKVLYPSEPAWSRGNKPPGPPANVLVQIAQACEARPGPCALDTASRSRVDSDINRLHRALEARGLAGKHFMVKDSCLCVMPETRLVAMRKA